VENVPDADEAPETEENENESATTDEQAAKETARKMRRVFQAPSDDNGSLQNSNAMR